MPTSAEMPTMISAVVSSTCIADFRNDSPLNIAVYQITVRPAAMPNRAMAMRFLLPG